MFFQRPPPPRGRKSAARPLTLTPTQFISTRIRRSGAHLWLCGIVCEGQRRIEGFRFPCGGVVGGCGVGGGVRATRCRTGHSATFISAINFLLILSLPGSILRPKAPSVDVPVANGSFRLPEPLKPDQNRRQMKGAPIKPKMKSQGSIQSSERPAPPPCSALQSGADCRIDPDVLSVYVQSFSSHLCSLASQHMKSNSNVATRHPDRRMGGAGGLFLAVTGRHYLRSAGLRSACFLSRGDKLFI